MEPTSKFNGRVLLSVNGKSNRNRVSYVFLSSVAILLLLVVLLSMKLQESEQAWIRCDQRTVNVAELRSTKTVRVSFKLVNESNVTLLLSEVKTSCSCIPAYWSKDSISPGDTTIVSLRYSPRSGGYGAFTETAKVYSNARNSPYTLFIKGHVVE